MQKILLSSPHMGIEEIKYIQQAFESNWLAPVGPNIDAFEQQLANKVNSKVATAVSSGTAALHLALILLGITNGDRVFCSTLTFVASANPISYQGAEAVFIDSDYQSWNMSPLALERAFEDALKNNKLPKAVIVVHLYGQSAAMHPIMELCNYYNVPIIEDAAESLGASYHGKASGTFGKLGIYSFNGNKIITTSGGGMLISDDQLLIEKAKFLATQARDPMHYYCHSTTGYNYRMSNVLAGIGCGQLKLLEQRVQARRAVFKTYETELKEVRALKWMPELPNSLSTRWLSTCLLDPNHTHITPDQLIANLDYHGIEARRIWKPMHTQPLFTKNSYFAHQPKLSIADQLFKYGICLPSGSNLTPTQQGYVIDSIKEIFSQERPNNAKMSTQISAY